MTKGWFETPAISTESFLLSISIISGRHLNGILRQQDNGSKRKSPTNTIVKVEIIGDPVDRAVGCTRICQVIILLTMLINYVETETCSHTHKAIM